MRRLALLLPLLPVLAQEPFNGAPIERAIATGETLAFSYPVQAGQFVLVRAHQLEGNVQIALVDTAGKKIIDRDVLSALGAEIAPWIADASGNCRIEIRNPSQRQARFRLEATMATPTEADRHRHTAMMTTMTAAGFVKERTKEGYGKAVETFRAALAEWRLAGDKLNEATTANQAGVPTYLLGKTEDARALFDSVLTLVGDSPDAMAVVASALSNSGQAYLSLGNLAMSRQRLEQAIVIRQKMGDTQGESFSHTNIANVYRRLGELELASQSVRRAIELQRQNKDLGAEMVARHNLAAIYMDARNYQGALEEFSIELKYARDTKNQTSEYHALEGLTRVYSALGEPALARQFGEQMVDLARRTGTQQILSAALFTHGSTLQKSRELKGARALMEESLSVARKAELPLQVAGALNGLCNVLTGMGEYAAARPVSAEAVPLNRKVAPGTGLPRALTCAAGLETQAQRHDAAAKLLEEALTVATGPEARTAVLGELARMESRRGDARAGLLYLEEAAALTEATRAAVRDPAVRAAAGAEQASRGALYTELMMALHKAEPESGYARRAYEMAERTRARSFAEMIADARAFAPPVRSPEDARRESQLVAAITGVQRQLFRDGVTAERRKALLRELAGAESELGLFQARLARGPAREMEASVNVARIQSELLDDKSALVSYSLGRNESYAWVVTREGFRAIPLAGREGIETSVEALRAMLGKPVSALTAGRSMGAIDAEARRLQGLVLRPLAGALAGKTRLVIVPDGRLHYLPFEVLPGVLEQYRISYAPSASVLAALRNRAAGRTTPERTLLAVADPVVSGAVGEQRGFAFTRLPQARLEAEALRGLFTGARVLAGAEAGEGAVKREELGGYRYLHFATHGYFDEAYPARSGLVLGQGGDDDGFLQAREIFGMTLRAEVVTLSACQSGLGRLLEGEGVMGLSRAFLYAGAQSMVVSLWNVNDAATAELMRRFYSHLKGGVARDEALRRAKLGLMKGPNRLWRHPYFWAPFVYSGDGA